MSNVGQKELNVNKSSVKTVYILVGPKGSGKTFIGNALEDRLGILFIRVEKLLIEYVEKNGTTKVVRYGKRGMKSTGTVCVPGEPVTTSIGWHNDDGTLLGVVRQGGRTISVIEGRWRIRGSRIISTSTVRSLVGDWTQSVNTIRVNSRRFDTQSTTSLGLRVVGSINKR